MTHPVPGHPVSTGYGVRGSHWSCDRDTAGQGIHTGVDVAAPPGTPIVATIDGTIRHRSYGSAFGGHQFAISPDPDQPFAAGEVFYAHTRTRLHDGARVKAGDTVAEVGAEGNVTGPHLHYEQHTGKGVWSCSVITDPQPTLDHQGDDDMPLTDADIDRIAKAVWNRDLDGQTASWYLKQAHRIVRRFLGAGGDAPAGDTMLARIDHNTR